MKISWKKKIDTLSRAEYSITIPVVEVRSKLDKHVQEASTTVRVPGFRLGKAPGKLILNSLPQDDLKKLLKQELQQKAFSELAHQLQVEAVGPPIFSDGEFSFDEDYQFDVDFAKEINPPKPSHEKRMPIIGDLAGNPMAIHERMFGEALKGGKETDHLPNDLRSVMPDRMVKESRSMLQDSRDMPGKFVKVKPEPGDVRTVESAIKTPEPEELTVGLPHEKLEEKVKAPEKDLEEKLPETEFKPKTEIETPRTDEPRTSKDLERQFKTPSQVQEGMNENRQTMHRDNDIAEESHK